MKFVTTLRTFRLELLLWTLMTWLIISLFTRLGLTVFSFHAIDPNLSLLGSFLIGFGYDLLSGSYYIAVLAVLLALLPNRLLRNWGGMALIAIMLAFFVFLWVFTAVAEFVFWEEFSLRFNFIAVDYLVYTQEVVDNILQSYPVAWIVAAAAIVSLMIAAPTLRHLNRMKSVLPFESIALRWLPALVLPVAVTLADLAISQKSVPQFVNNYHTELAKNGTYSLFSAFWNNELPYTEFYPLLSIDELDREVRQELAAPAHPFLSNEPLDWRRRISTSSNGTEQSWNVVIITVESLSASFFANWGNRDGLTPNLDALMADSIVFENLYATGTRTVRGLESLMTMLPPTPGRSIVKRPYGDRVPTIGAEFAKRGYAMSFLYGGHGFFDNMNRFFSGNGYQIIDRPKKRSEEITFENAWGACDGDLYNWALEDAEQAYEAGRPFHQFIMTTSNHRPYTYPQGKVDIPSGSGRKGAVTYTDFAIGEFLDKARTQPWFAETVFVIIADHCANSAGKTELDPAGYHIPALIYAPSLIEPQRIAPLSSQMDLMPTLFGLLNWTVESTSFGRNALLAEVDDGRAYFGNYQKLGWMKNDRFTVLSPAGEPHAYRRRNPGQAPDPVAVEADDLRCTIAVYEGTDVIIRPFKD